MKYFEPRIINYVPYLLFDLVAKDKEELKCQDMSEFTYPDLIIPEDKLPETKYGVCVLDIKDNKYVKRSDAKLNAAKIAYDLANTKKLNRTLDESVKDKLQYFEFDGEQFSLSANAQLNWVRLGMMHANSLTETYTYISTLTDNTYTLKQSDVKKFIATFNKTVSDVLAANRMSKLK